VKQSLVRIKPRDTIKLREHPKGYSTKLYRKLYNGRE
jgi:hypothetical protein